MITASIWIELPEGYYITDLSQAFPDATFRLLAGVHTGETAVELGEIIAKQPTAAAEQFAAHPTVQEYQQLELTDDRSLGKYETTDTGLYAFIEDSSLPPEFPITAKDGWFQLDFTGTRERFDQLRAGLDAAGMAYELHSLVESDESSALLTSRQREVLDTAMRKGYFEVPRQCTLAELATQFEIDKSTASTIIRRGENRILQWFLAGQGQRTVG